MYVKIAAEIALAALAVFGLYALLRLFVTVRLGVARVHWVLYVTADTTSGQLPELLQAALDERFFYPDAPLLVLAQQGTDAVVLQELRRQGVRLFVTEKM